MQARRLKIGLLLVLAFTAATAWGKEGDEAVACAFNFGDVSGRVLPRFTNSEAQLHDLLNGGRYHFALTQFSPNPLAAHPEWGQMSRELAAMFIEKGWRHHWPLGRPMIESMKPLFLHYEAMMKSLDEGKMPTYFTDRGAVRTALLKQILWALKHPKAAHIPPLTQFLPMSTVLKPKSVFVSLYEEHARKLAARDLPIPLSLNKTEGYFIQYPSAPALAGAPSEIVDIVAKIGPYNPLKNLEFSKFALALLDSPTTPIETVIEGLVAGIKGRFNDGAHWLSYLRRDVYSGATSEAELAAYFAFYFPEILKQAHLLKMGIPKRDFEYLIKQGYNGTEGRGILWNGKGTPGTVRIPAQEEAEGWNVRNVDDSRPVALAMAYLTGEKKLGEKRVPASDVGKPALEPQAETTATPPSHLPTAASEAEPQPVLPRPVRAPEKLVEFTLTPKVKLEAWPALAFDSSSSHGIAIAADNLMLAHLDIAASLQSAHEQFRKSEEKIERVALAELETFLKKTDRKAADFPPAVEAVGKLLLLNAAKLKHVDVLKTDSSELVVQMKEGLESLQALKGQLPSREGASGETLEKIHTILETHRALDGVAKNTASVDRNIRELGAQLLADKATLTKIVQLVGNPLALETVPTDSLIARLEALAKDGH